MDNLDLALQLASMGWKVFPCGPDKKPIIPKREGGNGYLDATADPDKIFTWWERYPLAVVGLACAHSGLFVLDLDRHPGQPDGVAMFTDLVNQNGGQPVEVGPAQTTPGGGYHLVFKAPRMPDDFDLPRKLAPGIDIRYRGSVCSGALPDGRAYQWQPQHNFDAPLTYPPAWIAKMLLRHHEQAVAARAPSRPAKPRQDGRLSPGDDFASQTDWSAILPPGWKRTGVKGDVEYWTRPGKERGVSATVNYGEHDTLYIFSTNASPFEPGKSYSKFAAYALLQHGGDFKAAARALAAAGYGSQKER